MRDPLDWPKNMVDSMTEYAKCAGTFLECGTAREILVPMTDDGFWGVMKTGVLLEGEGWHGPNLLSVAVWGDGVKDLMGLWRKVTHLLAEGALFGWHTGPDAHVYRKVNGRLRRISQWDHA